MKFAALLLTSTIVMFIMMYLNTYAVSDIWLIETGTYMVLCIGAGMAIIMLVSMLGMFTNKKFNFIHKSQ